MQAHKESEKLKSETFEVEYGGDKISVSVSNILKSAAAAVGEL